MTSLHLSTSLRILRVLDIEETLDSSVYAWECSDDYAGENTAIGELLSSKFGLFLIELSAFSISGVISN
jgi:hypothetical protein